MAPASSLMYAGSGTISIIHKLSDFKGFRCHKNVTIISIKSILNCPSNPAPPCYNTDHVTFLPHYQQLIFSTCCCTREKGRTHSPHPHVTILIMYPFPHYQQLIFSSCCCAREKGCKPKTSKTGCIISSTIGNIQSIPYFGQLLISCSIHSQLSEISGIQQPRGC